MTAPFLTPRSAAETAALLPYPALARSVDGVLRELDRLTAPERVALRLAGDATLLVMSAADDDIAVTKLVTVHPDRRPSVQADLWVLDVRTGARLLWLDGAVVTARRTAAVSLLAAQALAPDPTGTLLILGAGAQATSHLEAFAAGLGTRAARIYARSAERRDRLVQHGRALGLACAAVEHRDATLDAAIDEAALIVCATPARTPILHRARPDAFIAAVGAYRPDLAEVAPALVLRARVYVDSLAGARAEAGDLLQAPLDWSTVTPLAQALDGPRPRGPVLFKSVGHALWDLAAARLAIRSVAVATPPLGTSTSPA